MSTASASQVEGMRAAAMSGITSGGRLVSDAAAAVAAAAVAAEGAGASPELLAVGVAQLNKDDAGAMLCDCITLLAHTTGAWAVHVLVVVVVSGAKVSGGAGRPG